MSNTSRNATRIESIEWLRGIASLGICIVHIFFTLNYFDSQDVFYQRYFRYFQEMGRFWVPMFFVISGFIITYSLDKKSYSLKAYPVFWIRRIIRIQIPYIASLVIAMGSLYIYSVVSAKETPSLNSKNLLLNAVYGNVFLDSPWINPVAWTLFIEIQFYTLIGLIVPFIRGNKVIHTLTLWLVLLTCLRFAVYEGTERFLPFYFDVFMAGILSFKRYRGLISCSSFAIQMGIVLALIAMIHGKAYALASTLAVLVILPNYQIPLKSLYRLGQLSYSLYLIHWTLGVEILRNWFTLTYPASGPVLKSLAGLSILGVCLAFAALFYQCIEKPAIALARRVVP
ncbi:hypothetical protein BWI97_13725 [Siphonobacter sp. BAB-5405]|uniref:acyltransferase family protein n=1 Tax=Siphonobacter sp. BAB-5405 TaxID=1864825 RepID=UPI000C80F595|nr:acyltransferase [Siphonobacter sp. BAB-5405]PMD95921.1 hypothetical protein BWI97_13725 [Siphonobacter sp. BAB-5405]